MFKLNTLGLAVLCIVLSACGGGKSTKDEEYLKSQQMPPLEVPPDLIRPKNDPELAIPKVKAKLDKNILKSAKGVSFYKDAGVKWLRVSAPVQEVWPQILRFWEVRGYSIHLKDKQIGIVETDWLSERTQVKGKTPLRNKYRVRIEKGSNNSTLVFVSHRSLEKQAGKWRSLPSNYEKEVEMLRRLLIHFGLKDSSAGSVLRKIKHLGMKVKVKEEGASVQLMVDGEYQRVWRRLGLAIDRAGMIMMHKNNKKGEFVLKYAKQKYTMSVKRAGDTATRIRVAPKMDSRQIRKIFSEFFII